MNPDWVIFGISSDSDGVVLYASSSLSAIELEAQYEMDYFRSYPWEWQVPRFRHVDMTVSMHQYVIVQGETYADALRKLMNMYGEPERWHTQTPEIEPQRGLPEGRDNG